MILILGAMPEEISGLLRKLQGGNQRPLFHQPLWTSGPGTPGTVHYGKIAGKRVALTTAGVGKVQAALTAGILLDRHRDDISHVIFTGVAGGLKSDIEIGDLVVADATMQHDVDATALNGLGFALVRGQIPFTPSPTVNCDAELIQIAMGFVPQASRKVHQGLIISGDQFLNGPLRRTLGYIDSLGGSAIEMEGAAVAVAAQGFGVPHIVIRTISDKADDSGPENFAKFMETVAVQNTVSMVEHILARLP